VPEMSSGPGMGPSFGFHGALAAWQWSPFSLLVLALVVAAASWYLQADWRLAERGRRWSARRTASFMGGLLAVDLALQSPIATFTGRYFPAHVIQHLMLMIVAPPLLAMGAPSTLLLQTAGRRTKARWLEVLRSRAFAVLTHPVSAWVLYFGVMFVFFLTPLINVAMNHMDLMDAINLLFLAGGCLYWWPMVGVDPIVHWKMGYGARMFNVLVGAAPETFLGIAILSLNRPVASMYTLASTHAGGGLLWSSTEIATAIGFVPIFVQWMHSEERLAARLDRLGPVAVTGAGGSGPDTAPSLWEQTWLARRGVVPVPLETEPRATPVE